MNINWKGILFWSNQFYGIGAVLLAVASNLLLLHTVPDIFILLFIHLITVLYYTHAYLVEFKEGIYNDRSIWYQKHKIYLRYRQLTFTFFCIYIGIFKLNILKVVYNTKFEFKIYLIVTLLLSAVYYLPTLNQKIPNLIRNNGIFKSISIAWVWTITTCFIPVWFSTEIKNGSLFISDAFLIYSAQVFLFILALAILFDIKDIYKDSNENVNTLVVKLGILKTINRIIVPLLILNAILVLWLFCISKLTVLYVLFEFIVLVLTYIVSRVVVHIKSIHANIILIDGLIVLKAILSICCFIICNFVPTVKK